MNKLNAQDISDFWRDPLLKTSDTLTSLFHDLAIIVEGDSDARFFRAMLDAIYKDDSEYLPDIRFFHCGGKDRVAKIASALKSAGVPVICVVDIDILDNKQKFIELYSACGGDAESVKDEISFIQQFVAEKRSSITSSDAKIKIDAIFSNIDARQPIPSHKINELNDIIQNSSSWRYVKSNGETFFTGGMPYNTFTSICEKSKNLGLLINRFGELENLCKTVTPRKNEWLSLVLQKDLAEDSDLNLARNFTREIVEVAKKLLL